MDQQSKPDESEGRPEYLGSEADEEEPAPSRDELLTVGEYLGDQAPVEIEAGKVEQTSDGWEARRVNIRVSTLGLIILGLIMVLLTWL